MRDQLSKVNVYIAGICSLIVTAGVARFSYTSLLPLMQSTAGLTEVGGGWLATINYLGYLVGVLIVSKLNNIKHKYVLYRLYLVLAVLTTAAMALTTDIYLWAILRFVSGICTSAGFIIASGLILKWLVHQGERGELGIHFSGIGLSIFIAAALVEVLLKLSVSWQYQWIYLSLMAVVFAIPAWIWMPDPARNMQNLLVTKVVDHPPSKTFTWLIMAAYFCAGYGYVVSATFIVDIVEGLPALKGHGQQVFIILGLAATPAVLLADRVARKWGYLRTLFLAYTLQIVGIILPTLSDNLLVIAISAILFGATFVAIVSLVLTMAGHFYPSNPAKFMGKMTLTYGVAQIIAPASTGLLAAWLGNYNFGLYLSAGTMLIGSLLVTYLIKRDENP
ncbi:YbfB/YjiJ family MFS transporter [Paraglaciecola polaris]|uniref:Major facilitator superfamily permease n=1 Tax=Paraglaciecola polaris LMG 21857 TaxID=1129793 RepID=K7A6K6_9ALTE|nr:YbfB/YjiJ family MFS transporter [Paraglaciecola polaris]GAC31095.1 major facilitator superfamily permease [Paraglaciecola polaris LMG 21857]|tara:strand:- start:42060 stop:43232 length:1173 start_codon:yes stop_codon:yes gene_type:complete